MVSDTIAPILKTKLVDLSVEHFQQKSIGLGNLDQK